MTLQDILIQFKKQTHMNNETIAKHIGVSKSTVGRWINGDTKNMRKETLSRLSELMGIDIMETISQDAFTHKKPILGTVKAGYNLFADENLEGYLSVSDEDHKKGDYFLRVTGDSMYLAKIHDQDLIYVKQCQDVPNGSIAVVMIGDEATVKRVIKKPNVFVLEAANPDVENKYFTPEEVEQLPVRIIGQVIYSRSDFI